MTIALNVFQAGEKAIAKEVNENFAALSDEISSISESIRADVTNAFAEEKEQILGDIEVVNNSKLNLNLDNVKDEGLQKIYSGLAMNTSAGVSVASDWVATQNGWLYMKHKNNSDGQNFRVKIDGVEVYYSGDSGTWSTGHQTGSVAFIGKEQVLTYSGSGTNSVTFYPCIGGN